MDIGLIKDIFNCVVLADKPLMLKDLAEEAGCGLKDAQAAITNLYKGGYVLKDEDGGAYRFNTALNSKKIEGLVKAAITAADLLLLSPVAISERPSFKYQRKAESVILKENVDAAKKRGYQHIDNLESLARAATEAKDSYLSEVAAKDVKLKMLIDIAAATEHAFWEHAKTLPTASV